MTRPIAMDLAAVRGGLRDFQLSTVDSVVARMFDPDPAKRSMRFLVADEVGLGKTYVARGIIAEMIDRLKDEVDDVNGVARPKRIDVVYVCSNAQIARQNMRRINPLPKQMDLADRLTLLPSVAHDLSASRVNMISLTPGTSLHLGDSGGRGDERVVLYWLLRRAWGAGPLQRRGSIELLRVGKGAQAFRRELGTRAPRLDPVATSTFIRTLEAQPGIREDFDRLSHQARLGRQRTSWQARAEMNRLVGRLRVLLAQASISTLEPDLVILDEFQRFAGLLDGDDEASLLARSLFQWPDVRVLLLSATPYRMYTVRGDAEEEGDHFGDFMRTVRFLMDDDSRSARLSKDLTHFRRALASRATLEELEAIQSRITDQLRSVMVRTERLAVASESLTARVQPDLVPTAADIRAYLGVERLARHVGAGGTVDYWKSAPYLLSFLEGYQLRQRLDADFTAHEPELAAALRNSTAALGNLDVTRYRSIDPGHPKLRALVQDLDQESAFDLVWVPPCLPTTRLSGAYARASEAGFTKRLVFSAWQAAPRGVASMLSYEAERRANHGRFEDYAKRKTRNPLAIRGREGEPADMAKFVLLLPIPELAALGDPRRYARETGAALPVDPEALLDHVETALRRRLAAPLRAAKADGAPDQDWYWLAMLYLDRDRQWLRSTGAYAKDAGRDETDPDSDGGKRTATRAESMNWLLRHAERACAATANLDRAMREAGRPPQDLLRVLALLAVASPANAAWRSVETLIPHARGDERPIRNHLVRDQATAMARSLRAMLQLPEIEGIIRAGRGDSDDYWRAVLHHSLDGGLPAVLEEDLHWLAESSGLSSKSWRQLQETGCRLAAEFDKQAGLVASDIRVTTMRPIGTTVHRPDVKLRHHFAVRLGARASDQKSEERAVNTREAFNGPFWPFVLVSTSIGQEGLDFQPYSHAVVHWNLPHNPVDLEQREGRVNRYKGHAVRKNVARAFGDRPEVLAAGDPWRTLFALAGQESRRAGYDELVPYWLYPIEGGAAIERHVPLLALSRDTHHYEDLKRTLGLYRLSFGQPRQEDLIALLQSAYSDEQLADMIATLRIDLAPQ